MSLVRTTYTGNQFINSFACLSDDVSNIAESKGWKKGNDAESIALMHSELSETLEAIRYDNPPSEHIPKYSSVEEELADVIIRIMHYAHLRDLYIGGAVIEKIEFNRGRQYKHGGKKF